MTRLAPLAVTVLVLAAASVGPAAAGSNGCDQTRHLVLVDARTGAVDCTSPDASEPVTASVADGNGG